MAESMQSARNVCFFFFAFLLLYNGFKEVRMKTVLRKTAAVLFTVVLFLSSVIPVFAQGEEFDDFLFSEWKAMMESDFMSMHFSVRDYRAKGLEKKNISFGETGYAYYQNLVRQDQESLDRLHSFRYDSLSESQKYDYLVYERFLHDEIARSVCADFIEKFNPYSGEFGDLPSMLTEFVFFEKEDIDDYLLLLQDYDRYCEDMLEFTQQQAEKGYFLLDISLDETEQLIDSFLAKQEDNPLIVIFDQNIDAFAGLSEEERTAYKQKNHDIVFQEILPENERIKQELEKLRGSRSVQDSLYYYPDGRGKEYYAALTRYNTGSSDSPQKCFDYLNKALKESMNALVAVTLRMEEEPADLSFSSPQEILEYLRSHLGHFPENPHENYIVSYLDPSIANPSTRAYYMLCPIDDIDYNVIRINGDLTDGDTTGLYATLAHEGFPGHLYQFTWYVGTNPNPLRNELEMMGYQEGWAQYVQRDLLLQSGLDELSARYFFLNSYFSYAANAAADLAVNGLGYTPEKLAKWMTSVGLEESGAQGLYDYVIMMPGEILSYGYGQMKFLEYRERVIHALGDQFSETEFHQVLLENGPRPFEVLEDDLNRYCKAKGKRLGKGFTFFKSEHIEDIGIAKVLSFFIFHPEALPCILVGALILFILIIGLIVFGIVRLFKKKKRKPAEL